MSETLAWPPTDQWTVLACTLWMEARGDGLPGMQAVANVVMNRVRNPRWWGDDIISVCLKPDQFSSWNPGSDQIAKVQEAMVNGDLDYKVALHLTQLAIMGILPDTTGNADSYYADYIGTPSYDKPSEFTVEIGSQKFYRTELPPLVG